MVGEVSYVYKFRAILKFLPWLLPASPSCAGGLDAALPPTTTAPTGSPTRNPSTLLAGVPGGTSPVQKKPAREKPTVAAFTKDGEKTCVSSRDKTCSRSVTTSLLNGLPGVAVKSSPSSIV